MKGRQEVRHRIVLFCHEHSATQEIHFLRPLRTPIERGDCQIILVDEASLAGIRVSKRSDGVEQFWETFCPTLAIFSRYAGDAYNLLVGIARVHGTPIVAHIDDDLFNVPSLLGEQKREFHSDPRRLRALRAIFSAADLIYVPTHSLAELIRALGFAADVIVPPVQVAAAPDELMRQPRDRRGAITIGYMGSGSHRHDLDLVLPPLLRVLDEFTAVRFETFGTIDMPASLGRFGERIRARPPAANYSAFLAELKSVGWEIGLAPLQALRFNEFRTYTKWLEYTLAGIAVAASDSPVYRNVMNSGEGILVAPNEWLGVLRELIASDDLRRSLVACAQRKVEAELGPKQLASCILSLEQSARSAYRGGLSGPGSVMA